MKNAGLAVEPPENIVLGKKLVGDNEDGLENGDQRSHLITSDKQNTYCKVIIYNTIFL